MAADEFARTDSLDRKAGSLASFASLVLALTASLGGGLLDTFADWWALTLYLLGLAALALSLGSAVRVLLPKEHLALGIAYLERFPTWSELLKPPERVRGETMKGIIESIAEERRINSRKAREVRRAFLLLATGLTFVVLDASILGVKELLA